MSAFLEILYKDNSKEVIPCVNVMTLGRDRSSTIWLKDPLISRNHGVIRAIGHDQYYLLDTGSRNGMFLNSRRISSPVQLKNGDLLKVGDTVMTFIQDTNENENYETQSDFTETMHYVKTDIRSVLVLVSDIRGFTTLSESIPIESLTKVMSYWFQEVQALVEANSGIVDKFIGDCVLAKWEVESGNQQSLMQVLKTVIELNKLTAGLYDKYPEIGKVLRIGVGLNHGDAAVGIGADNTIMGDMVNTTFRLESASKDLGADVVINSSFFKLLPDADSMINERTISVKGKSHELSVSAINFDIVEDYLKKMNIL